MTRILALDQSTSATKAMLFTTAGALLDKEALPHRQFYPRPGWVEHDAEEIYQNTLVSLSTLLKRWQGVEDDLLCLSLTNQRETVVVFDRETGAPLHKAIVWQCRRGEALCKQLEAAGHGALVQERTGLKLDTYFPASKLNWLFQNRPALKARVAAGEALVGTIDAYLIYRLTGGATFATDHTNASRTLLYDIERLQWDDELCDLFGVPLAALPEVRESSASFGRTDLGGQLAAPIPIAGVMGDSQAALFAQRAFQPGAAKVTFGSGSSVLMNIGSRLRRSRRGIVTTIAWTHEGEPTYAFEGITNFTGATIAWLRDQLELIETVEETEALAHAVPDNGGVYFVPAFVGLSAPYWRPEARAALIGLTPGSTRQHVVRAALEGIAYRIHDVLALMGSEAGITLTHVNADGGAVGNRFLMQFVADVTRLTVKASRLPELSALGAVFAGALATGVYHSLDDIARLAQEFVEYVPALPAASAAAYYDGWREAVARVVVKPVIEESEPVEQAPKDERGDNVDE